MSDTLTPLESGTDLNQALRFHSRERRKSLAGVPEMFRTHYEHVPNWPDKAWRVEDDPATFTDETADFISATTGDVLPFPATEEVDDYFAMGYRTEFAKLQIDTGTARSGGTLVWEYWSGAAWSSLSPTDGTNTLSTLGLQDVTFTPPSDWASTSLNGEKPLFYVRLRVTVVMTTNPVLDEGRVADLALDAAKYPDTDILVTFWTGIRITGATPVGLIFEIGSSTTGVAAWLDDTTINFRAGDAPAADRGLATFDNTVSLPDTLELDLVFAVRPGDGRVRIWGNGNEIARDAASGGSLPNGWAAASDGSFAAPALGTIAADVTQTGAPSDFDVIQPLSVFVGQVPRHFV